MTSHSSTPPPRRQNLRLPGYDYSQPGGYFVTIVSQKRMCLFCEVVGGEMCLSHSGKMVQGWWLELEHKFQMLELGAYIVMPNHFHGIVVITEVDDRRGGPMCPPGVDTQVDPYNPSLSTMIQWFKTMTTNEYICGVKQLGWQPFDRRLWQRGYHEHILRNEDDLCNIHDYILSNPANWAADVENPLSAP